MHYSHAATIFLIAFATAACIAAFIMMPLAMALDHGRSEVARSPVAAYYAPWLRAARRLHVRALVIFGALLTVALASVLVPGASPRDPSPLTTCALAILAWQGGSVVWSTFMLMDTKPEWVRVTKSDSLRAPADAQDLSTTAE